MNRVYQGNEEVIQRIRSSFDREYFVQPPQYSNARIKYDDCIITIYDSGKVMFQGANAGIYAATFFPEKEITLPQCGSDEVGTGDYFGPVCVCACYLDDRIYEKIRDLNVIDSKQLTDTYIEKIAPKLIENVPHSLLILTNRQYNDVIRENNLNKIKARMHNKCYLNLMDKGIRLPQLTVIDDFCGEDKYYRYIRYEKDIVRNITFETKAENKYAAVACGAIISRYAFLESMKAMSEKYGMTFPKGAGSKVNEFGKAFIEKYGQGELINVAKLNFKNTAEII